jgi:rhodanese-related sulfurtransferase
MDPIPEISHHNLMGALLDGSATLIDVNGTESYQAGHIPSAIDFEAKSSVLADLLPADKSALIVVYCGGPECSAYLRGARAVETLGYTNVRHYADGISGWKASMGEVETLVAT